MTQCFTEDRVILNIDKTAGDIRTREALKQRMFTLLAAAILLGAPMAAHAGDTGHSVTTAEKMAWAPLDPKQPGGIQLAVLYGDPAKPGPIGWADKHFKGTGARGGFGILLDDFVAAFCTLVVIALWRFW